MLAEKYRLRRVRVFNGYAAHARFLAECDDSEFCWIPRLINEPYSSGPTHGLYCWRGQYVIVVETKHRRYEVFAVTGRVFATEEQAMAVQVVLEVNP